MTRITADLLVKAYACGVFPMAESSDAEDMFWVKPDVRAILPLDRFHISHSLKKTVRRQPFRVTFDAAFTDVMQACADRPETWINDPILSLYAELHGMRLAHSIECWEGQDLVGGLYGVSLGAAFFGESMFHRTTDASKVALVHLVARLIHGGYQLLDAQFHTDHLGQFGAVEIRQEDYLALLAKALERPADFYSLPPDSSGEAALQEITQTS